MGEETGMNCIFCDCIDSKDRFVAENELAFAIYDAFPVNEGHVLVIPKRHFRSFFEATKAEVAAIYDLLHEARALLEVRLKPDGYNVGVNIGEAAGQTVMHLHVHLIPRYRGDVENPRGGIRNLKKSLVPYDG